MKKLMMMLGIGLLAAGGMTHDARAGECGMGDDIDWYAGERMKVSQAEELLDAGHEREAAWVVQTTWHRMREARPVTGSMAHIAEAVRVVALACVRTGGDVKAGFGWSSGTAEERAANVRWGVSRLRMLAAANPSSMVAKVDLGEALSRSPRTEKEGSDLLESLDAQHLVTTPEGLAALARVRLAHGDGEGSAVALAACEALMVAADRCATPRPEAVITASTAP
jgi:hypothetical protein